MNYFKELLNNRLSIILVLINWIFLLSLFLDFLSHPGMRLYLGGFPDFLLVILNLPAILIAVLIWSPYYFIDMPEIFKNGAIATSFFTITIQWLIVGKLVSRVINRRNQKVIEVSIFDAN